MAFQHPLIQSWGKLPMSVCLCASVCVQARKGESDQEITLTQKPLPALPAELNFQAEWRSSVRSRQIKENYTNSKVASTQHLFSVPIKFLVLVWWQMSAIISVLTRQKMWATAAEVHSLWPPSLVLVLFSDSPGPFTPLPTSSSLPFSPGRWLH